MRATTALLADAAQVTGGKLYVLGGGFDSITSRSYPAIHRTMTVAVVLEVGPAERGVDLPIAVRLIDEDGHFLGVESKGSLRVKVQDDLPPGQTSLVPLVTVFDRVRIPSEGGYAFVVEHRGAEVTRVRFRARQA